MWTGPTFDGYGRIKIGKRAHGVHRISYEWVNGPIPEGMILDHKCRVRHCVRPDHLQIVTRALNMQNLGIRVDNTTGVRGVTYRPASQKYAVRVQAPGGKRISCGLFDSLAEAEAVAIATRNELMTNNLQDRAA